MSTICSKYQLESFACLINNDDVEMIMTIQSSIFKLNEQNIKFQKVSLWINILNVRHIHIYFQDDNIKRLHIEFNFQNSIM